MTKAELEEALKSAEAANDALIDLNKHMVQWLRLIAESAPSDDMDPHPEWANAALKGWTTADADAHAIPWATMPLPVNPKSNMAVRLAELEEALSE